LQEEKNEDVGSCASPQSPAERHGGANGHAASYEQIESVIAGLHCVSMQYGDRSDGKRRVDAAIDLIRSLSRVTAQ
jgi:hypothetical protein